MRRIAVVGHYGADANMIDGQTIKVRSLVEAINKERPDIKIDIADTYYFMNNRRIYFVCSLLKSILINHHIIFFAAFRGRQYMFKFFYWVGKILRKKIYHDCIAGSLDIELLDHPEWRKYLNHFEYNWMESPAQVEKLRNAGIRNVMYLPNFKSLSPITISETAVTIDKTQLNFCTFSRVEPNKGIEDALYAVRELRKCTGVEVFVDIYGPVEKGKEKWFENLCHEYADVCQYKGVIPYDKSVEVLKNYFALIFPTRYFTEGMPGTIIDAMFAGLPVIARRWAWCDNMIHSGYNGISYDFDKPEQLNDIIVSCVKDPQSLLEMRKNCLAESSKYSSNSVCEQIFKCMNI